MAISEITVSNLESIPLAVVRRRARSSELATVVPEGCGIVWSFVRANGLHAGRNVALYWDGAINVDVGVELADYFADSADVVHSATPAGRTVTVTHFGSYGRLGDAHEAIRQWCDGNGLTLAGPSWEVYGHWQNEWNSDPSQIRTDVHYLVR